MWQGAGILPFPHGQNRHASVYSTGASSTVTLFYSAMPFRIAIKGGFMYAFVTWWWTMRPASYSGYNMSECHLERTQSIALVLRSCINVEFSKFVQDSPLISVHSNFVQLLCNLDELVWLWFYWNSAHSNGNFRNTSFVVERHYFTPHG